MNMGIDTTYAKRAGAQISDAESMASSVKKRLPFPMDVSFGSCEARTSQHPGYFAFISTFMLPIDNPQEEQAKVVAMVQKQLVAEGWELFRSNAVKKCTWCGKEFPAEATVCPIDRRPLVFPTPCANSSTVPTPRANSTTMKRVCHASANFALLSASGFLLLGILEAFTKFRFRWAFQENLIEGLILVGCPVSSIIALVGVFKYGRAKLLWKGLVGLTVTLCLALGYIWMRRQFGG